MNKIRRSFMLVAVSLIVTACVGNGAAPSKSAKSALTNQYRVSSMTISVTEDVRVNELPRFAKEPKEKTVETLKSYVNTAMRKTVAPAFIGPKPVDIDVQITRVQFATNGGVIVMQASSYMSGIVTMKDAKTGEVVKASRVNIEERPFRGGGLIGVVVAAGVNSGTTPQKRYTDMTNKFAAEALAVLK